MALNLGANQYTGPAYTAKACFMVAGDITTSVNNGRQAWPKVSLYKVVLTQPWDFCWLHSFQKLCWKPWCLLLLRQNTHSTNATCALTVGCKFVNDLKNWFSLPSLWCHWMICVTGQKLLIYKNPIAGSAQLCEEKLWAGPISSLLIWMSMPRPVWPDS